ncbi:MAG: anti-sigma factor antagonist [Pseudonocardiaceae bacterium]|nr:MAG: anti-sigma factor antagonist [Pseudonocardiaceae bacterium]
MSPMISPAPGGFEVRAHVPVPSVAVLRPEGELDMVTAPELVVRVEFHLDQERHVVLDLRDVDLLTSNALQALLVVHNAAQRRGLRLRITGTDHGAVARVLGQTGLDAVLPITALSTEEAVAALAHPRPDARG